MTYYGKKRYWVDLAEIKGERESIKEATTEKLSKFYYLMTSGLSTS